MAPTKPSLYRYEKPARACTLCDAWLASGNPYEKCSPCLAAEFSDPPTELHELHVDAINLPTAAVRMLVSTNG